MTKDEITDVVLKEFQSISADQALIVEKETTLEAVGLDSMNIINILLKFEKKLELEFDGVFGMDPPETVGEIVNLICTAADDHVAVS